MQLQKFTAKYHLPQEAIHDWELSIIISTITELNLSKWAEQMPLVATAQPFMARITFSTSYLSTQLAGPSR